MTKVVVETEDLEFILAVLKSSVDDVGRAISMVNKWLCETNIKKEFDNHVCDDTCKLWGCFLLFEKREPYYDKIFHDAKQAILMAGLAEKVLGPYKDGKK